MLCKLLEQDRLLPMETFVVRRALAHGLCWPADPLLAERAMLHGFSPPQAPAPGEVPLLSISLDRSMIWLLGCEGSGAASSHLVDSGLDALRLAEQLAIRELPLLFSLDELPATAAWKPAFLVREGRGIDELLKGESFGLSMLLGVASRLLGLPVPGDVAASAALDPNGSIRRVDGLRQKIALLAGWGLGLRRFFVAAEQAAEARALAEAAGASFEVVPVESARSAIAQVFGDVEVRIAERLLAQSGVNDAAASIFDLALRGDGRLLDWHGVERGAELLGRLVPAGDPHRFQAAFARQVARRHQGKPGPIPMPTEAELGGLHIDMRHSYFAHRLQSMSDMAAAERDVFLGWIRADLPSPMKSSGAELELHGAVGRALRTLRRYDEASEQLRATVAAWQATRKLEKASFALAAWLHVLGIRQDRAGIDTALSFAERFERLPARDANSMAFIAFDCGRALLLTGDAERALAWLGGGAADWALVPAHLRRSRLRWLAAAHRTLGDGGKAEAALAELAREPETIEHGLAQLDEALGAGLPLATPLAACAAAEPELVGAYLDPALPLQAQAERLAAEYPY